MLCTTASIGGVIGDAIMLFCNVVQWLSYQICNVCALVETSTKFCILVGMVATITTGYRITSAAPLLADGVIY